MQWCWTRAACLCTPVQESTRLPGAAAAAAAPSSFGLFGAAGSAPASAGEMAFRMLARRGGKDDRSKELLVPLTSKLSLAAQRVQQQEDELEEIRRITRAAAMSQQRQEEEEVLSAINTTGARPYYRGGGRGRGRGSAG